MSKPGVNEPCPCGSRKKYKRCCRNKDRKRGSAGASSQADVSAEAGTSSLASMELTDDPEALIAKLRASQDVVLPGPLQTMLPESLRAVSQMQQERKNLVAEIRQKFPSWPAWEELDPTRWIAMEDIMNVLPPQQGYLLSLLSELVAFPVPEAKAYVLDVLNTIPREEALCMEYLLSMKIELLKGEEHLEEKYATAMEYLLHWPQQEKLWLRYGCEMFRWLRDFPQHQMTRSFLDRLQKVYMKSKLPMPAFLFAFGRFKQEETLSPEIQRCLEEALLPQRWPWLTDRRVSKPRSPFQTLPPFKTTKWLYYMAISFEQLCLRYLEHEELTKLQRKANEFLRFAWERLNKEFHTPILQHIDPVMEHGGCLNELQQLCQRLARAGSTSGRVMYWLGHAAALADREKQALGWYRKACKDPSTLTDSQRINIAQFLLESQPESALALLEVCQDSEHPSILYGKFACNQAMGRQTEAIAIVEKACQLYPEDTEFQARYMYMMFEMDPEGTEAMIQARRSDPSPAIRCLADILWGVRCCVAEDLEQALTLFDNLPDPWPESIILQSKTLLMYYHHSYGTCLQNAERWEEAQYHVEQCLQYHISPEIIHQLALLAFHTKRIDTFEAILSQLQESNIEPQDLLNYQLYLSIVKGDWDQVWHLFQQHTEEWHQANKQEFVWLHLNLYLLPVYESPLAAFRFAEAHLDEIMQDETLRAARNDVVKGLNEWIDEALATQAKQAKQLQQAEHKSQRHQEQQKQLEQHMQRMLQRDETSHLSTVTDQDKEKEAPQFALFRERHSELLTRLSSDDQQILEDAEYLWLHLAEQPDRDHGPVVTQWARVLEGLVNLALVDPLVQFALDHDFSLQDFPPLQGPGLQLHNNRLALGKATLLLYHQLKQPEADGTYSYQYNPHSSPAHRELLNQFWQTVTPPDIRTYWQTQGIRDLQLVTRWRNRSSHAGIPVPRPQATTIRDLLFGNPEPTGLFAKILPLYPDSL